MRFASSAVMFYLVWQRKSDLKKHTCMGYRCEAISRGRPLYTATFGKEQRILPGMIVSKNAEEGAKYSPAPPSRFEKLKCTSFCKYIIENT